MTIKPFKQSTLLTLLEKYWWIVFCVAVITSYVIIVLVANGQNIWFDEGYSILLAKKSVHDLLALTAVDAHPPFYYLLLKVWGSLFGWSEFALRTLSALVAAGSVGVMLVLIRKLFSMKVALVTIPFIILAPFFLRYGYEVRMYALVGLIAVSGTLVLVKAVEKNSRKWWVVYMLLVALGMYSLYMSAVVWLAHVIWLTVIAVKQRQPIMKQPWAKAYIGAAILFLPYIPTFIHQLTHSALPGIGNVLNIDGLSGVLGLTMSYTPSWQIGGILSLALLLIVGLGIYLCTFILKSLRVVDRRWLYLILACFFVPLLFYVAISLLPKPFFIPRYLAHIILFFYALLGIITALGFRFGKKKTSVIFGGVSLLLLVLGVFQLYSTGNLNFERMQLPKTAHIRQLVVCDSSSVIVADDPYTYIDSVYYYNGCNLRFYSKENVDFSGGYAPLHNSELRVADVTNMTQPTLYVLHWASSDPSFKVPMNYTLKSSITIEKQVVDRYERLP
jgi:mannosyltransferase